MKLRLSILLLWLALLTPAAPAFAQGCALCSTAASAAGAKAQKALSRGVLILLVPPTAVMLGLIGIVFRQRRSRNQ